MIGFKEYCETLFEQKTEEHSLAKNIAKNIGTKLKNFRYETYKDGSKIPGAVSYTFQDDVSHENAKKALDDMGFKSPSFTGMHKDHENMTSTSDSHISPTHMVLFTAGHGETFRMHVQER